MLRKLLILLVRIFIKLTCRVTTEGLENIPQNERIVIASNHLGTLDAPLILSLPPFIKHPNLIVPVAKKHSKYAIYRFLVKYVDFLWLDRFNPDFKTLKEILKRMENPASLLIIAPEGTRSPTGALIQAKPGVVFLTTKSRARIIPAAITNTEDVRVRKSFKNFKRHPIHVKIGKPFSIPDMPRKDKDAFMEKYTDEIMCQIAALLPQKYRGVYTEHPRLKELLS